MKLVQLYLIGVFVMIGLLAASTFWQYQQFQTNFRNMSFNLPPELANMPNASQEFSKFLNQTPTQQNQAQAQNQTPTEFKQYTASDNSFTFDYPSDWQTLTTQPIDDTQGKLIFSGQKMTTGNNAVSSTFLAVYESNEKSIQAIIDGNRQNARANGDGAVKITESEIINGSQTIKVVQTEYNIKEPTTKINIKSVFRNAIFLANEKIYIVSINENNNDSATSIADQIFASIKITALKNETEK